MYHNCVGIIIEQHFLTYFRIKRLYFCDMEYLKPGSKQSEESKRIVWKRLKNHIECMSNLGDCQVVCASGSNKTEWRFKCKTSYRRRNNKKEEVEDGHQLCTFNFTVKWDDSGYYIPPLNNYQKRNNNGCPWHSCITEEWRAWCDFDLLIFFWIWMCTICWCREIEI